MNQYELALVISPEMDEEAMAAFLNKVSQWITDGSGQVIKIDQWGRRKLAYPIRKFRDGYYVFIITEMGPGSVKTLVQNFNISEVVLRYFVTRKDD